MCELFGYTSKNPTRMDAYLVRFFEHSVDHPDGWGLAEFGNGEVRVTRQTICANASHVIPVILDEKRSSYVIAHIRQATIGRVAPENCHPFSGQDASGRTWHLAHNGTLNNGKLVEKFKNVQSGTTDSERVLLYLLELNNAEIKARNRPLDSAERSMCVETLCKNLAMQNSLNLIIFDGEQMYIHGNIEGALHYKKTDTEVLFSTRPLGRFGWDQIPLSRVLTFKDGKLIREGESHGFRMPKFCTIHDAQKNLLSA